MFVPAVPIGAKVTLMLASQVIAALQRKPHPDKDGGARRVEQLSI